MSTTSGGDTMKENSVTTIYNGDRTITNQRVSSSSNGDSGFDNSNTESSAGDAKLIIDMPDFSRDMETPRAGIDNPSFETDKTDVPKPLTNGHNGTVNQENGGKHEKDKMAEAVNLELINMKPFSKSINGKENGVAAKKKETAVNLNDTYDDYFIPVNEHKKYIRGGEKLYVTKDKRDINQSKKPFICWVFGLVLLAAAVIVAILASTGVIFNNETAMESRNFMNNEKIASFGNRHEHFSSVSPAPSVESSSPYSQQTTDMSGIYVPRAIQGEIVIDNMQFTPGLSNASSPEFVALARSIESEMKNALFKEQPLNGASDTMHIKVFEFTSGSVIAKYRIGWEYKDDNEPQDVIDAENLITRLDTHLRENNGYLYNYRVPIHRLRSEPVIDKCKTEKTKCSHFCSYNYTRLDFVCSCPSELVLSENKKDCRRINDNIDEMDEFVFSKHDDDNVEVKSPFDSFSEPEPSPETEVNSESEPSSEPEVKSENDTSVEHEIKSESDVKAEHEPNSAPEVKAEPEPSSEPGFNSEAKEEPEPSSELEAKVEPEPSSEPEAKVEPEPSTEPEVKAQPEPTSETKAEPEIKSEPEPEVKAEPEPEVKAEPEPNSKSEVKTKPEPSSKPEVKAAEPESNSKSEVKSEPEPNSEPNIKAVPEPSSEPEVKAEPEPSSIPEVNVVPEPSPEPEVKIEPESSSEPEVKSEPEPSSVIESIPEPKSKTNQESITETKPEPEPEPSVKQNVNTNPVDIYESLSDVDISSELNSSEQENVKSNKKFSTEKTNFNIDQSDREAKSHSDEVFSHEIKPEITYAVSTESEFETKTELVSKETSKLDTNDYSLFENVNLNDPNEATTLSTITAENWLTTTLSSIKTNPKLPSDLEVTDEDMKTVSPLIIEQSENKPSTILTPETHKHIFEQLTESPEKFISDIVTSPTIGASSTIREDMISSSKEHVTEFIDMTTMSSIVEQEPIKVLNNLMESNNTSEKEHSDELSILEKTDIPDPSKKLQSLISPEEQITNVDHIDTISTSTQSNVDSFNENSAAEKHEPLDQIMTNVSEQDIVDTVYEDEKTSALDLYQKPELKKKDKKTTKNPEFYLSDSGFTKRNKTKTEKENKKNNKSDMDIILELFNSSKCEEGQFQCINSTTKDGSYCIKMASRCDSNKDCTDNSDEYDCFENACFNNFQCKSGECLQRNLVCNNIMDCVDGSDEQSCDLWKCADNEKSCTGGQCLPESYFCDGKSDCSDHSDELDCNTTCNGFQCPTSYCISSTLRCNGVNDCAGGEDEQNCECNAGEFKCNTGSECIPIIQVCDNTAQCTDRSDEYQCVQLNGTRLLARKESETTMKVCNNNWSDEWSNFVCRSLGFTEMKTTTFHTNESTENSIGYLKLKDDSNLNNSKSFTDYLEQITSCDTYVEIKCSSKNLCGDFGGKDPLSMEIWPSVVYLKNTKTQKSCTSSLVKRNWLLSTYSCIHSIDESMSPDQWVAISSKNRIANETNLTKRSVSRIISHPGVKYDKLRYLNNTVLIELSTPYDLSDEINTICLPEKVVDDKQPCVAVSWSYESPGVFKQFSRYLSDPLMQTDLCNSTKHFNGFLTEREICVASGEMEASNMEIGSPLMCLAENGLWEIQGMLSYRGGYGNSTKPSLYNAVINTVQWVENTITSGI